MPLIIAFIYGALAAGAALLFEGVILTGLAAGIILFVLGAGIEESLKLLLLIQWRKRFPSPSTPFRHFLAAACLGAGFAGIELWLAAPPTIAIILSLLSVHIATSVVLSLSTLAERPTLMLRAGVLGLAITLHAVYNLFFSSLQ